MNKKSPDRVDYHCRLCGNIQYCLDGEGPVRTEKYVCKRCLVGEKIYSMYENKLVEQLRKIISRMDKKKNNYEL